VARSPGHQQEGADQDPRAEADGVGDLAHRLQPGHPARAFGVLVGVDAGAL
jgi:hypothetical protein